MRFACWNGLIGEEASFVRFPVGWWLVVTYCRHWTSSTTLHLDSSRNYFFLRFVKYSQHSKTFQIKIVMKCQWCIFCVIQQVLNKWLLLKRKVLFELHLPYETKLKLSPQHFVQTTNTIKSSRANRTFGLWNAGLLEPNDAAVRCRGFYAIFLSWRLQGMCGYIPKQNVIEIH